MAVHGLGRSVGKQLGNPWDGFCEALGQKAVSCSKSTPRSQTSQQPKTAPMDQFCENIDEDFVDLLTALNQFVSDRV
jgi:hypothetical protein